MSTRGKGGGDGDRGGGRGRTPPNDDEAQDTRIAPGIGGARALANDDTRITNPDGAVARSASGFRGIADSTEGASVDVDLDMTLDVPIGDTAPASPRATLPPPARTTPPAEVSDRTYRLPQQLGRYTLTKLLGIGGMAEVFLAEQAGAAGFKKVCVVKRMLRHLAVQPRFVEMFLSEAHLASTLHHGNIVQIWDLGEVDGSYFIAMEYVDGLPLNVLTRTAWRAGKSVPTEVVCCALADTAEGLGVAHERLDENGQPAPIIHRDISPDNLMIGRDGVTKILDFGIARIGTGERTASGELKGKVPFMAPEQLRGEALDSRLDVYALGVTAYWLLTGKRPFSGATDLLVMQSILNDTPPEPIDVNPSVPRELNDLVMRMLEKDRRRRPASARDVARALEAVLPVRRTVVAPFVRTVLELPHRVNPDEPVSQTSGFLPSTPHTNTLKVGRLLISGTLGPNNDPTNLEVTSSGPSRKAPSPQDLVAVGRPGELVDAHDVHAADGSAAPPLEEPDTLKGKVPVLDMGLPELRPPAAPSTQLPVTQPLFPRVEDIEIPPEVQPRSRLPLLAAAGIVCALIVGVVVAGRSSSTDGPADAGAVTASDDETPPANPEQPVETAPVDPKPADPKPVDPKPVDPKPVEAQPVDPGQVDQKPGDSASPVETKPVETKPTPTRDDKDRDNKSRTRAAKQSVAVKAPGEVAWLVDGRAVGTGSGTLQIPASATRLVAFDKKRGVKTTIPVAANIDYAKLPRGKLQPRVKPFAEVFIGQVSLGTTPFAAVDVVAGSYTVKFVYKDKTQTKTIDVAAGAVVKPIVDFTAAP